MWTTLVGLALLVTVPEAPDAITADIEALLAKPDDPFAFGFPQALDASPFAYDDTAGSVRCLADGGDVDGDGAPDVLVGLGPRPGGRDVLFARSGTDGAVLWSRTLPADEAAGFRSLRGLAARDGRWAAAPGSVDGRVSVGDALTGDTLWSKALAPALPGDPALLHAVRWLDDLDADGVADLAVAGGHRVDALHVLSGADGATLWSHAAGDVVYDVRAVADQTGDGVADLAVVGGDELPFAALLSGADGQAQWNVPLDGAGSVVLPLDDVNGDGTGDLAVGQFNEPGACLLALSGADGARLWESLGTFRNVTSLDLLDDMLGTGLRDIAVGSFDNAVSGVLALNGLANWRREGSPFNTGAVLSIDVATDLDGDGQRDVYGATVARQLAVYGGSDGQYMANTECRAKLGVVLALGDGNGDGRPEIVTGGNDVFWIFDGNAGTADGPEIFVSPPEGPLEDTTVTTFAYPGTFLAVYISTGTGSLQVPGFGGTFGLDVTAFAQLFSGTTPGAGGTPLSIPPQPAASGLTLYVQSATIYGPGSGWLSNVAGWVVP